MSEVFGRWKKPDDATLRGRQRRALVKQAIVGVLSVACFCLFVTGLFGVPQSFLGQWWMKPPRYPNAVPFSYDEGWMLHEGEVCQMTSPGVYCYEWYYRTDDSIEDIIAYYGQVKWPLHSQIKFEWRRGRRFGLNWVAESNVRIFSNISGYQIIARPSPDGDTEIYILERGAVGDYRASDR